MRPVSSGVRTLIIATVLGFLLEVGSGKDIVASLALWPVRTHFMPWQLVTYAFLHASLAHLGGMVGGYLVVRRWLRRGRRN